MTPWKLQRRLAAERMLDPATPFDDCAETAEGTAILARAVLLTEFELLAWDYRIVGPDGATIDLSDFIEEPTNAP